MVTQSRSPQAPVTVQSAESSSKTTAVANTVQPQGNQAAMDNLGSVAPEEESSLLSNEGGPAVQGKGGPGAKPGIAGAAAPDGKSDGKPIPPSAKAVNPWEQSPECKVKLAELEDAVKAKKRRRDQKKIDALVKELIEVHKMPAAVVQSVVRGGDGLVTDAKNLAGGKLDVSGVKDDGSLGTRTTIDVGKQKGTFEGAENKVEVGAKGSGGYAEWTDKEDGTRVKASGGSDQQVKAGSSEVKAVGGAVEGSWGDKDGKDKGGRETIGVAAAVGKDAMGASASWSTEAGNTTTDRNAGWTQKGGSHTVGGAVTTTQKVGDQANVTATSGSVGVTPGKEGTDTKVKAEGRHSVKAGDESTEGGGAVTVQGEKVGISGDFSQTKGKESDKVSGSYNFDGAKDTHSASLNQSSKGVNADGVATSLSTGASLAAGPTSLALTTDNQEAVGDKSQSIKNTVTSDEKGSRQALNIGLKDGKNITNVNATRAQGQTSGGSLAVSVSDGQRALDGSFGEERAVTSDGQVSETLQGAVGVSDNKGTVNTADDVSVKLTGSIKQTIDPVANAQSTTVAGTGDMRFGATGLKLGVSQENGSTKGTNYEIKDISASVSTDIDLDDATKKKLQLSASGSGHFTTKPGDSDRFEATLGGKLTKGEGKEFSTASFSITGGQDEATKVASRVLGDKLKPSQALGAEALGTPSPDAPGTGSFIEGKAGFENGTEKYSGSLAYGNVAGTQMGSASFGYANKGDLKSSFDLYAGLAERDGKLASAIQLSTDIALNNNWSVMGGGGYSVKPGDEGYDQVWSAWAGTRYAPKKNMAISLRGGMTSTGEQMVFMPQIGLEYDKYKLIATGALGAGMQPSIGAELTTPIRGMSVYGGYGGMEGSSMPWGGEGAAPNTDWSKQGVMGAGGPAGGYIGIKFDLLKLIGQ